MSFSRRGRVKLKDFFKKEEFRKWLESLPDDQIVSKPRKGVTPVVSYLESIGLENVRITKGEPARIKFEKDGRKLVCYYDKRVIVPCRELFTCERKTARQVRSALYHFDKRTKKTACIRTNSIKD